jgi:hypothetical protein
MVHHRKAVIGAVTSLALAGLGCATWMQGSQSVRHGGINDDSAAARSASRVIAFPTPSAHEATPGLPNLVVQVQDGLLTVRTHGAPLSEVLAAITKSAGVTFAPEGDRGEKVWLDLGPRSVREVVSGLLERSSYGYAFVDSPGTADRAATMQVFLIKRGSASDLPGPTSVKPVSEAVSVWPLPSQIDEHSPPPNESALQQQRTVDAMFAACKAQACDSS